MTLFDEQGKTQDPMRIYNAVKTVPEYAMSTIGGGRMKGKTAIRQQWRILMMTEQFGPCGIGWKYDITSITYSDPDPEGQIACRARINLFFKYENVWSEAIPAVGGSFYIEKETQKLHASNECEKMAITDALGVAMKMLGIGSDVYLGVTSGPGEGPSDDKYSKKDNNQDIKPTGEFDKPIPTTGDKPWLTEPALDKAIKRIEAGENDVLKNMDKAFRMKTAYRQKLQDAEAKQAKQ
jgi:hypothetical protein